MTMLWTKPQGICKVNIPSASSQARPAPKPRPTHAGQALRLNRRTEKTTPKERPREDLMITEEMARSHYVSRIKGLAHVVESTGPCPKPCPKLMPRARASQALCSVAKKAQDRQALSLTFSLSRASLTGLVARAIGRDSLESAIAKNLPIND